MKRVYLSGKRAGSPYEEVKTHFKTAQSMLEKMGFEVINPVDGLNVSATWERQMLNDIAALFDCDTIYMLKNWKASVEASIEHDIAQRMDKDILFEVNDCKEKIPSLAEHIASCYNITVEMMLSGSRSRRNSSVCARRMYIKLLKDCTSMSLTEIGGMIKTAVSPFGVTHSTVIYTCKSIGNDIATDKYTREIYESSKAAILGGQIRII